LRVECRGMTDLDHAIALVPAGPWAVAVSGGADSVALLSLVRRRADIRAHVVHLDHETREGASAADARFVAELCAAWGIACTVARRGEVEPDRGALPVNLSARFRAARLALYRQVCAREGLQGVVLAHHAGDQAETILQRLLRGSGSAGLIGMRARTCVGGLVLLRPLLGVPGARLRELLTSIGQAWREDASNASPAYQRNRVRAVLAAHPELSVTVRDLGCAAARLTEWARDAAPVLGNVFETAMLGDLPDVLAVEAARAWLARQGASPGELSPGVLSRLIEMARDAATAPRAHFPGRLLVIRRGGRVSAVKWTNAR
jgi:tRNA(Ile)-lysidine synthase